MLARNQSHGSPANWLDLYAACDIPEIESFGRLEGGDTNRLVFKFASSAATVTGKPLVSSESATWLDEHFQETLGEVKEIVDRLFLGGVNHIFYHGTAYSPADAAWPGWLFYASTQFNPQNPLWRDFAALNEYVTRCQAVLQSTRPDNDILLYWPIHDFWQDERGLRKDLRVHNSREWFDATEFGETARWLEEHGYSFDYISDRQIIASEIEGGRIKTPGGRYAVLLFPGTRTLPLKTGRAVNRLAKGGATIVSYGQAPAGTPGRKFRDEQAEFDALAREFMPRMNRSDGFSRASLGQGQIVIAKDLDRTLQELKTPREAWAVEGRLQFLRRSWSGGSVYFIKNVSPEPFDERIQPVTDFATALIMDPVDGKIGRADYDADTGGLRLQLAPGQAVFVKTYRKSIDAPGWNYQAPAHLPSEVEGEWSVEFVAGGPELPPPFKTHRLASWTELAGAEGERFAGTARYTIRFAPDVAARRFLLDLGHVADSAR
ncbi:MAG: glycosyl hydrolase, partial [Pirellulales bacterium]